MTTNVQPTMEDINAVFSTNGTAAAQLQIVTLNRLLAEKDAEIEALQANQCECEKDDKKK